MNKTFLYRLIANSPASRASIQICVCVVLIRVHTIVNYLIRLINYPFDYRPNKRRVRVSVPVFFNVIIIILHGRQKYNENDNLPKRFKKHWGVTYQKFSFCLWYSTDCNRDSKSGVIVNAMALWFLACFSPICDMLVNIFLLFCLYGIWISGIQRQTYPHNKCSENLIIFKSQLLKKTNVKCFTFNDEQICKTNAILLHLREKKFSLTVNIAMESLAIHMMGRDQLILCIFVHDCHLNLQHFS